MEKQTPGDANSLKNEQDYGADKFPTPHFELLVEHHNANVSITKQFF
jgi:hypothetical protein